MRKPVQRRDRWPVASGRWRNVDVEMLRRLWVSLSHLDIIERCQVIGARVSRGWKAVYDKAVNLRLHMPSSVRHYLDEVGAERRERTKQTPAQLAERCRNGD